MKLPPLDQANLIAGHAVAAATAFLDGRHDAARLADNADRLFLDMLVVECAETSAFLVPVQLLAIVMMRTARCAIDIDVSEERLKRWEQVMGSLVELVCHESRQLKRPQQILQLDRQLTPAEADDLRKAWKEAHE